MAVKRDLASTSALEAVVGSSASRALEAVEESYATRLAVSVKDPDLAQPEHDHRRRPTLPLTPAFMRDVCVRLDLAALSRAEKSKKKKKKLTMTVTLIPPVPRGHNHRRPTQHIGDLIEALDLAASEAEISSAFMRWMENLNNGSLFEYCIANGSPFDAQACLDDRARAVQRVPEGTREIHDMEYCSPLCSCSHCSIL